MLVAGLWFAVTSVGGAQVAPSADDEVARNLFQAGRAAYDAGNYDDALEFFEKSHARSLRPQLLYNIGQAADRLRDDQKALASFRAYLAAVPDAANRVEVENRIRALDRPRPSDAVVTPMSPAPTPTETAQAATPTPPSAPVPSAAPATSAPPAALATDDTPITGQWWFWTAIGGGVAAVVITAVALSSGDTTQGPLESNTGVTVTALGGGR
jgi:tetratricopeptide (TPR) repeat protein